MSAPSRRSVWPDGTNAPKKLTVFVPVSEDEFKGGIIGRDKIDGPVTSWTHCVEVEVIPVADVQKAEGERDLFAEQSRGDAGRLIEVEDERDKALADAQKVEAERLTERRKVLLQVAEAFETRPANEAMRCSEVALYCREQAAGENPEGTEEGTR